MLIHLLFRTADFYFQGQFICGYIIFHLCLAYNCKMYSFSANQNDINRHNTLKLRKRIFTSKVYVEENLFITELLCVLSVLSPSFVRM